VTGGPIANMILPAAMGVLAEAVMFFLPVRTMSLPLTGKLLAWAFLVFVAAFALTNSLRMASIVSADQAAARADRQTERVRTADQALEAAERSGMRRAAEGSARRSPASRVRPRSPSWRGNRPWPATRLPPRPSLRAPTSPSWWHGSATARCSPAPTTSTSSGCSSGRFCPRWVAWS
jgi:hypothetical protein